MAWKSNQQDDDMEELFASDVPATVPVISSGAAAHVSVPVHSTSPPAAAPVAGASSSAPYIPPRRRAAEVKQGASSQRYHDNTLDESIVATLARDLRSIWGNLKLVCAPFSRQDEVENMLKHWDLWGPLMFTLLLAALLSAASGSQEVMFSMVIVVVVGGAVVLTCNVILLGGAISFFQSICLLGYCLFPLDVSALICWLVSNRWVRLTAILVGLAWSVKASVPFVGGSVSSNRHFLAVYPVFLMYSFLSWLTFVS